MSIEQPFACEVPKCTNRCSRLPHVCTKHFIEGWGRLPDMPLPVKEVFGIISSTSFTGEEIMPNPKHAGGRPPKKR